MFGRREHHNPADDNIVRVEARELRKRLDRYFADEGKSEALGIAIPKGSYAPVFEERVGAALAAGPSPAPACEANSRALAPPPLAELAGPANELAAGNVASYPRIRVRHAWRGVAIALFAAVALLAILRGRFGNPPRLAALPTAGLPAPEQSTEIWPLLFPYHSPVKIVVADSALVLVEELTHKRVSLQDYVSGAYLDKLNNPEAAVIAERRYTNFADVILTNGLLGVLERQGLSCSVLYPRDLTMWDLEKDNLVFSGSPTSDPWIDEFAPQSNFRSEGGGRCCFANQRPQAGESSQYCAGPLASQSYSTYGLVTFLPNLQHTGNVLILQGTTGEGTEAAADFVTNPYYSSLLRSSLGRGRDAKSLPYFEVLLETTVVRNTPGRLKVVAHRIIKF